ncbi:MAG: hypothetical protein JSC085_000670 [Candidatus Tokpelaia sp. JSC085]|nr:MAG: hypothetical protein JSC085_000670 [Candidatus Tokpelaia sp. JSC085]
MAAGIIYHETGTREAADRTFYIICLLLARCSYSSLEWIPGKVLSSSS